ncbi:MAG: HAD family hydrolase [Synergistaceae bacterium]|nr:HAD family hydrolase [Synergistaceae bacterium]
MSINGAIFDADGTLLNSMHVWRNLGERYLITLGIVPEEGLSGKLWPLSYDEGCEYLRKNYNLKRSVSEIQQGISRMIEKFYAEEAELKPGVRDFLDALNDKNIPMVIATSGDRDLLRSALVRNDIADYFAAVFTCSELNTDKQHSKIFTACADFLKLKPENIAVFEDSLFAIEAAKSAGFVTFGVYDASSINDKERIIETADYFIDDWRKLCNENSFDDCRKRQLRRCGHSGRY